MHLHIVSIQYIPYSIHIHYFNQRENSTIHYKYNTADEILTQSKLLFTHTLQDTKNNRI